MFNKTSLAIKAIKNINKELKGSHTRLEKKILEESAKRISILPSNDSDKENTKKQIKNSMDILKNNSSSDEAYESLEELYEYL